MFASPKGLIFHHQSRISPNNCWKDFVGIVVLLIINTRISFTEENNAGNAAAALMAGLDPKTKVLRDGKWSEQEASILVPGDLISVKLVKFLPLTQWFRKGAPATTIFTQSMLQTSTELTKFQSKFHPQLRRAVEGTFTEEPGSEVDPEFDLEIRDDVRDECSKYGQVKHIHVDKNSAGYVYLRFDSVDAASLAQQAMHKRWFARILISAIFLVIACEED